MSDFFAVDSQFKLLSHAPTPPEKAHAITTELYVAFNSIAIPDVINPNKIEQPRVITEIHHALFLLEMPIFAIIINAKYVIDAIVKLKQKVTKRPNIRITNIAVKKQDTALWKSVTFESRSPLYPMIVPPIQGHNIIIIRKCLMPVI